MASSKRILFITGEVKPYTEITDVASLVRALPEELEDVGDVEARVFMPRYGTISERKNSLHEVIRLSGTDVPMGDATEQVTVKVATVPDTRLQVYFMDNPNYFKRKAVAQDGDGNPFDDNPERALFFARSVLETIKKLRWGPDVIHSIGWAAGWVPALVRTQYAGDELISSARTVYTPDAVNSGPALSQDDTAALQLSLDDAAGKTLAEIGEAYADATVFPASIEPNGTSARQLNGKDQRAEQLMSLYESLLQKATV